MVTLTPDNESYDGAFASLTFIRQSLGEIDRSIQKENLEQACAEFCLLHFWIGEFYRRRSGARRCRTLPHRGRLEP